MRPITHILVIVDPTSQSQPCVEKGASLARAFGAMLELFVCDYQPGLDTGLGAPFEVIEAAMTQRRVQLDALLRSLAEPLRHASLRVITDCSMQQRLHAGVIEKVQTSSADLVIKDTHYHNVIRRALFTNTDWHLIRECPAPLLLTKPAVWKSPLRVAAAIDPGHNDDKPASLDRDLLETAAGLAAEMGGEAMAVHAFDPLPLLASMAPAGSAAILDVQVVDHLRSFHKAQFNAVLAGYPAYAGHAELIEGSPVVELPEFTAKKGVDVLVTGAVSRSALQRLVVGSTAERLLDRLPCDILVLKPAQVAA